MQFRYKGKHGTPHGMTSDSKIKKYPAMHPKLLKSFKIYRKPIFLSNYCMEAYATLLSNMFFNIQNLYPLISPRCN